MSGKYRCELRFALLIGTRLMTNADEERVGRIAESKGYHLEKVGKGPHHGRFSIVKKAGGFTPALRYPWL